MLDAGSLVKLSSCNDSLHKGETRSLSPAPFQSSSFYHLRTVVAPGQQCRLLHKPRGGCLHCSTLQEDQGLFRMFPWQAHIPLVFSLTSAPRGPGCDQKHCYLALLLAKAVPHLSRLPLAARRPTRERGGGGLRSCRSLSEPRVRVRGGGREGGAPRGGLRALSYTLRLCCGPSTGAQ